MFDESNSSSITRRCLEEALSVQDMLSPAPCTEDAGSPGRMIGVLPRWIPGSRGSADFVGKLYGRLHARPTPTVASERARATCAVTWFVLARLDGRREERERGSAGGRRGQGAGQRDGRDSVRPAMPHPLAAATAAAPSGHAAAPPSVLRRRTQGISDDLPWSRRRDPRSQGGAGMEGIEPRNRKTWLSHETRQAAPPHWTARTA